MSTSSDVNLINTNSTQDTRIENQVHKINEYLKFKEEFLFVTHIEIKGS